MGKPTRRLSQASCIVSSYIHDLVAKDDRHDSKNGLPYLESLSVYSLSLPGNQTQGSNPSDSFLTDRRMRRTLEELGLINWCPGIEELIPLAVTNDGNTLCHSTSLALWGVHDRKLHLRRLIGQALMGHAEQELRQRWQKQLATSRSNLHHNDYQQDMDAEWQVLNELTSDRNKSVRSSNPLYEPLEEFHIFVLANIIRRPIIVFSERPIRSAEPEDTSSCFVAVYLPVLWESKSCCCSPLVMGYCDNYFAPLITFNGGTERIKYKDPCPAVVPLVGIDKIPIEHRYLTEQEEVIKDELMKKYLFIAEIEATGKNRVSHVITVAKLVPNPLSESQNLISEFFNQQVTQEQKEVEIATKTERQFTRKLSKFRCGNKVCTKFIDQDHLFPYCSECHPNFTPTVSKPSQVAPTRRKMNSANTVVPPTSLEIECATVGCPYYAAVSSFPYCQRCKSSQNETTPAPVTQPSPESLEERWQKLAMGLVDGQLASSVSTTTLDDRDEILFSRVNSNMLLEDGEKCGFGGATSSRSSLPEVQKQTKTSATGARSGPQRKVSREELLLATNAIDLGNTDDWKRKVSWINEPCARTGCTYFASTRTYPYCNQCTSDMHNAPAAAATAQRRRKVSGTCTLSTLVQED